MIQGCGIGSEETLRMTSQEQSVCVSRGFQDGRGWIEKRGG